MKPATVILYIWMALLTGWAVYIDVPVIEHINAKHQAAGKWMKANSEDIKLIREYLADNPGHTH